MIHPVKTAAALAALAFVSLASATEVAPYFET